jgi:hypothetical protein
MSAIPAGDVFDVLSSSRARLHRRGVLGDGLSVAQWSNSLADLRASGVPFTRRKGSPIALISLFNNPHGISLGRLSHCFVLSSQVIGQADSDRQVGLSFARWPICTLVFGETGGEVRSTLVKLASKSALVFLRSGW